MYLGLLILLSYPEACYALVRLLGLTEAVTDIRDKSDFEPDTNDDDMQMLLDRQLYEPEPNAPTSEFATNAPINQLEARIYQKHLAKLHDVIKARAQIPTKPAY